MSVHGVSRDIDRLKGQPFPLATTYQDHAHHINILVQKTQSITNNLTKMIRHRKVEKP